MLLYHKKCMPSWIRKHLWNYGIQQRTIQLQIMKNKLMFLRNTSFCTKPVVLKLCKHAERLRSFRSFCQTPYLSNTTESKNGLLKSDDLRRAPETALLNPAGLIEPSLRTTAQNVFHKYTRQATYSIRNFPNWKFQTDFQIRSLWQISCNPNLHCSILAARC